MRVYLFTTIFVPYLTLRHVARVKMNHESIIEETDTSIDIIEGSLELNCTQSNDSFITQIKKRVRYNPLESSSEEDDDNEQLPPTSDANEIIGSTSPSSSREVRCDLIARKNSQSPIVIPDSSSDDDSWSLQDLGDSWVDPTSKFSSTKVESGKAVVELSSDSVISDEEITPEDVSPFILGRHDTSESQSDTPYIVLNDDEIKEIQSRREVETSSGPSFEVRTNQATDRSTITPRRKEELENEAQRLRHLRSRCLNQYKELKVKYETEKSSCIDGGLQLLQSLKKAENCISDTSERLAFVEKKLKTSKVEVVAVDSIEDVTPEFPQAEGVVKELGKRALATLNSQKALTEDALQRLYKALETTEEATLIEPSSKLKISLKPHQVSALSWLVEREKQKYPTGGILADDMGLGKTLTMLALVLQNLNLENPQETADDSFLDEDYTEKSKPTEYGGTLVVCPTSVMGQWESEIKNRIRQGSLNFYLHHGTKREQRASRLAVHDLVITSYTILQKEATGNKSCPLMEVKWARIILDESQVIRNHKTLTSKAAFQLKGDRRWCLTGTPIQNKIGDLFAVLKFLRVSPFDELSTFNVWINNNDAAGQERLNCILKSIMMRRTKEGVIKEGQLNLKEKHITTIKVQLKPDEAAIYEEVSLFSKNVFAKFITLKAAKEHLLEHGYPVLNQGAVQQDNPFEKHPELNRLFGKMMNNAKVDSIHILLLLLRLRQLCCHPSLITKMFEKDDSELAFEETAITDNKFTNDDIVSGMNRLSLLPSDITDETKENEESSHEPLSLSNPIFSSSRESTKLEQVVNCLLEKVIPVGDKALIISQFTSVLDLIRKMLEKRKVKSTSLTGKTPVIERGPIIDQFNTNKCGPQVMLLSLQAGGTGLNLVGANCILFVDPHWNPQLERQAFDRVYRMGQTKDVFIYKFICEDTIEEQILKLQENKLAIADGVLAGSKKVSSNRLTIEDLKMLFNPLGTKL